MDLLQTILWVGGGGGALVLLVRASAKAADRRRAEHARDVERARTMAAEPLTPISSDGIAALKKGEVAYYLTTAELLEERVIGYRGRSQGVSIRVAKGLYYRTGTSRGTAERGYVCTAKGKLLCTSQRLILMGEPKSVTLNLKDVLRVDASESAVVVTTDKKTAHFRLNNLVNAAVVASRVQKARQQIA